MALFEELPFGSLASRTLLDLALLVAAPVLLPVVGAMVRPVVKLAVTSGIVVYDAAATLVTTAGEELAQIVAEARATVTEGLVASPPPADDSALHILRPGGASA